MPQWTDATAATAAGFDASKAAMYFAPDGVLPRMRLIACGWVNVGDDFKHPEDKAWWSAPYRYRLWPQLTPYAILVDQVTHSPMTWDAGVAAGDIGDITQAMQLTVQELAPVIEAPCPKWIIPPNGGYPTPNPECAKKALPGKDKLKPLLPGSPSSSTSWLWLLLLGAYLLGRKRR